MERSPARRRRGAVGALSCLALAAFVFGATLRDGPSSARQTVAEPLPQKLLAGERIVVGVDGTSIDHGLRSAVREGRIAVVVLFPGNFPSRSAGRRLIARLQGIPRPPKLRDPL